MQFNFGNEFKSLKSKMESAINSNPSLKGKLEDAEFSVGLAGSAGFGIPLHAKDHALFVGDSNLIGELQGATAELEVMFKKNPKSVMMTPKWNWRTQKFDMVASKYVADADVLTPAQLMSPWNVGWFQGVYKKPLSYSRASDLVKIYSGTSPWAEVMNLLLADYSGFAAFTNQGRADSTLSQDIAVKAGFMTSAVINASVTWALTTEEIERSKESSSVNPFAGSLMNQKQQYADYVLNMLKAYLIYYGYDVTGTIGLLSVNTVTAWTTIGASLTAINADGTNVTKGSTAYRLLATALRNFLTSADNKFNYVKISMSPLAFNLLATLVYSDTYNPDSAIAIIKKNLVADMTKDGRPLKLDIISDPMLKASSDFNAEVYDYLLFVATEIEAGPDEESQDVVLFGEPLSEFMYPTIPGSFHTQYRKLKRLSGVFCPVKQAVKAYSGFGV